MEFTIDGNYYQVRDSEELIYVVGVSGSHFFDRGAMKGFRSKLEPKIFEAPEGIYFITSERFGSIFTDLKEPRKWTIRLFNLKGKIRNVKINDEDGFQKFNSRSQAVRYIEKNLLKGGD